MSLHEAGDGGFQFFSLPGGRKSYFRTARMKRSAYKGEKNGKHSDEHIWSNLNNRRCSVWDRSAGQAETESALAHPRPDCRGRAQVLARISPHKSASVYQWSSGDCRFGMSDGQNESCSGPEVGFEDIAADLRETRFLANFREADKPGVDRIDQHERVSHGPTSTVRRIRELCEFTQKVLDCRHITSGLRKRAGRERQRSGNRQSLIVEQF